MGEAGGNGLSVPKEPMQRYGVFQQPVFFFLLFHVHIYTLKELSNLVKRNEKHLLSQVAITSKRAASWFEDAALIMLDGGRLHNYHRIFYIFLERDVIVFEVNHGWRKLLTPIQTSVRLNQHVLGFHHHDFHFWLDIFFFHVFFVLNGCHRIGSVPSLVKNDYVG